MVTGKWAMGNCQWSMVNGEWSPANGQKANCQWPLAKGHWPIANGELVMAIWKLWKTNCVCIKKRKLKRHQGIKCERAMVNSEWSKVMGNHEKSKWFSYKQRKCIRLKHVNIFACGATKGTNIKRKLFFAQNGLRNLRCTKRVYYYERF